MQTRTHQEDLQRLDPRAPPRAAPTLPRRRIECLQRTLLLRGETEWLHVPVALTRPLDLALDLVTAASALQGRSLGVSGIVSRMNPVAFDFDFDFDVDFESLRRSARGWLTLARAGPHQAFCSTSSALTACCAASRASHPPAYALRPPCCSRAPPSSAARTSCRTLPH